MPQEKRLTTVLQLCTRNDWAHDDIASCLRDGPLAELAAQVHPRDDREATPHLRPSRLRPRSMGACCRLYGERDGPR